MTHLNLDYVILVGFWWFLLDSRNWWGVDTCLEFRYEPAYGIIHVLMPDGIVELYVYMDVTRSDFTKCRMRLVWLILKQDGSVEEVIRLMVYLLLIFNTYHGPSPTLWEVVTNGMSYFWRVPSRPERLYYWFSTYSADSLN